VDNLKEFSPICHTSIKEKQTQRKRENGEYVVMALTMVIQSLESEVRKLRAKNKRLERMNFELQQFWDDGDCVSDVKNQPSQSYDFSKFLSLN
jgi:hypothetical protein